MSEIFHMVMHLVVAILVIVELFSFPFLGGGNNIYEATQICIFMFEKFTRLTKIFLRIKQL